MIFKCRIMWAYTSCAPFMQVICILGLIGNLLAMIVVCNSPTLKTASTIFIFNLALADFLFLLSIPIATASLLMEKWVFGNIMCKIYFGCFGINIFSSIYTLTIMSLDRYVAVCCSLKYNNFQKPVICLISCVLIWIGATLLSLPLLLYSKAENDTCNLHWSADSAISFTIYRIILGFFLPMTLITVFYTLIIVKLCKQSPSLSRSHKKKRTRKVTILVLCIILVFFSCWLPYWCYQIVFIINIRLNKQPSHPEIMGYHVATALYKLNSALNPVLYGFLSSSFRKAVCKLLKCEEKTSNLGSTRYSTRITSFLLSLRMRKSSSRPTRTSATELECNAFPCTSAKLLKENGDKPNNNGVVAEAMQENLMCSLNPPANWRQLVYILFNTFVADKFVCYTIKLQTPLKCHLSTFSFV